MTTPLGLRIAGAYRWHRRLGARTIETPQGCIVADPERPQVWESNHVDAVSAARDEEIDALFAAMETHLAHAEDRVVYTDGFTPDAFLARIAFADYRECFLAIQMALQGPARVTPIPLDLRFIDSEADWGRFAALVRLNHVEGHATGGMVLPPEFTAQMVAVYRAKAPACRFRLVFKDGEAIAYASSGAAPNGLGIVEDVFTRPEYRRRGVASTVIATLADELTRQGCDAVFLGALANEEAKRLYAKLGFRPVGLARTWVKPKSAR